MSPIQKFRKQMNAKKTVAGTLTIMVMILIVSFSSMLVLVPDFVKAVNISDFVSYKQITIDNTKVESNLINFPVWVYNVSDDFTNGILADGSDMAFYNEANDTQFNHEIEIWDKATGELGVWVNVTSVASGSDTIFYMYYNDTDTGESPNHNPTSVWDGDYLAVYHFNNSLTDSTANGKDLINNGSVASSSGKAAGCRDFEYDDSDYAFNEQIADLSTLTAMTIESWFNAETYPGDTGIFLCRSMAHTDGEDVIYINIKANNNIESFFATSGTTNRRAGRIDNSYVIGSWYHIAATFTSSDAYIYIHNESGTATGAHNTTVDGTPDWTQLTNDTLNVGMQEFDIGNRFFWDGRFDELRISKVVRSNAFINASYNSTNNSATFLTFGTQQDIGTVFVLNGLQGADKNITWSGSAGTTVWSNATYPGGTMEINMTINATDNVTEIRINCTDIDATITASNITLYVSSDNSSYGSLGAFLDGGNNLSINDTNWNDGTMGTNPFAGAGLTDKIANVYCRFTLAIPIGTSSGTYSSSNWKVDIGYI